MTNPLITIVTGTHNRLPHLQDMIHSARTSVPYAFPLHFIVVDAGSTDGTIEWCEAQPDITLIQHGARLGAIKAFTDGAYAAQSPYVVLANDDVLFTTQSLIRALVHLENTLRCGAVAFEDNRIIPPYYVDSKDFHVAYMPAREHGQQVSVYYAQVGMFRKWLGDALGWWRGFDERFAKARTYGGDNLISSNIWQAGYTVDKVAGCRVVDKVLEDDLRAHNREFGDQDSSAYYDVFPFGADIPDKPQLEQQDKRKLRIMYLPIIEANNPIQKTQKRGLREALAKRGIVYELDYLNVPEGRLEDVFLATLDAFQPDMLFTQIHGHVPLTEDMLSKARNLLRKMVVVNWTGDVYLNNLTSDPMLRVLRLIDLQLCVNVSALPIYQHHGIPAAYWQNAYEEPTENVKASKFPVIWLATAYHDARIELARKLRLHLGDHLGLYGAWWDRHNIDANGYNLYDFNEGAALYKGAKLALSTNEYPKDYGFVSNRLFQAMAAGGCALLQQHVDGLDELLGTVANEHYIEWWTHEDLLEKLDYYLDPKHEKERKQIAQAGTTFIREYHSFDARVNDLFGNLLGKANRQPRFIAALQYTGQRQTPFGVRSGKYVCEPGKPMHVDPLDAEELLRGEPALWKRIETVESAALIDGN